MKIYTPRQVAEILQISEETMLTLIRNGEFPAQKVGGQWRILEDGVKAYFDTDRIREYLKLVKELEEHLLFKNDVRKLEESE